jgi:hypothetical protein
MRIVNVARRARVAYPAQTFLKLALVIDQGQRATAVRRITNRRY